MKVVVIGKQLMQGTSRKTGKEYNANVVHVYHPKMGVEGNAVETIWLDPKSHPYDSIKVGKEYYAEYDSHGFLQNFSLV